MAVDLPALAPVAEVVGRPVAPAPTASASPPAFAAEARLDRDAPSGDALAPLARLLVQIARRRREQGGRPT